MALTSVPYQAQNSGMIDINDIAARLQKRKGKWRDLAEASGVPYFTLTKIARGTITNPGIDTINKLLPHIGDDAPEQHPSEQAA